jgi:hypothetical protein
VKKRLLPEMRWQERSATIFQASFGTLPTDATRENSFLNSQKIDIGIFNGFIKPGKGMD